MKEPVAIVGMGAIIPGAQECATYWNNILNTTCFIREIPEDFWRIEDFYDPDPSVPDRTYSKNAGVLDSIEFDAMEFGIPPKVMESTSVDQLYSLVAARQALIDAGLYGKDAKPFDRSKTGVIISANVAKNAFHLSLRTNAPVVKRLLKSCNVPEAMQDKIINAYKNSTLEWDEASNPGYLPSLCAGRVANRFNFGGINCSVDAACASGLMAVKLAAQELLVGNCDIMLAGGATLDLSNVTYISFCKTPALSVSDHIRPFDSRADGMLLGDGVCIVVLKRLSTAIADKDRIYATIEGIGTSSDGRAKSIYAPNKQGQMKAIRQALKNAEVDAKQIGMIETHGTGTVVGDDCEVDALSEIFNPDKEKERSIVIGSAKGQIGHLRLAAGIAGLIRASLALHHKQYIPTVGCEVLNPSVEKSNFHICRNAEPWIVNSRRPVRYAGVSAFGFGGSNCHMVLKEAQAEQSGPYRMTDMPCGILLSGKDKDALQKEILRFQKEVESDPDKLGSPEFTYRKLNNSYPRIAFTAKNADEAVEKAKAAYNALKEEADENWIKKDIIYRKNGIEKTKVTVLFPGQGSQNREMLNTMTGSYPELRQAFGLADNALLKHNSRPISEIVYAKAWSQEEQKNAENAIINTRYAQVSLAAVESGLYDIMSKRGFEADYMIGHSFGELVALYASGAYGQETLMQLSAARGMCMDNYIANEKTGMTAVLAGSEVVEKMIEGYENLSIANINSPDQIVVCGAISQLEDMERKADRDKVKYHRLSVAAAFHSPYMINAQKDFGEALNTISLGKPAKKVISNYSNDFYSDSESVKKNIYEQMTHPVLFESNINKAYESGSRVFVEVGPGGVLSKFTADCLRGKDCTVISVNPNKRADSVEQFEFAMLQLAALGFPILPDPYILRMSPDMKNKKTKGSYTVPPTYFMLPDTIDRINKATEEVPEQLEEEEKLEVAVEYSEWEDEEMNKIDAIYDIQKQNANIFENYLNSQKDQLNYIKNLPIPNREGEVDYNKLIIDCISGFQNNSMVALQTYFNGQGRLLGGPDIPVQNDELMPVEAAAARIQYEKKDTAAKTNNAVKQENKAEAKKEEVRKVEEKKVEEKKVEEKKPVNNTAGGKDCKDTVMNVIVALTGYPAEMISMDMELESDLGIDSIKRIEIFSQLNDALGNIFGQEDLTELSMIHTVEDCIQTVNSKLNSGN